MTLKESESEMASAKVKCAPRVGQARRLEDNFVHVEGLVGYERYKEDRVGGCVGDEVVMERELMESFWMRRLEVGARTTKAPTWRLRALQPSARQRHAVKRPSDFADVRVVSFRLRSCKESSM